MSIKVTLNQTKDAFTQFDLPGGKFYNLGMYVQKRAIFVQCTENVQLYGMSTRDQDVGAASAFYILPTRSLDMQPEYIIPSVPNNAMLGVVAIENNTSVSVDIKSNCPFFGNGGSKVLNARDVYQVASLQSGKGVYCTLGGTHIKSSKPVALYSGGVILLYPGDHGDHVLNQVRPLSQWGREYIIPQVINMDKYNIRIVAAHNDTNVTIYGKTTTSFVLGERQVHQEDHSTDDNVFISASKSILVSQIAGNDQGYDVFGSLVPPVTEYTSQYVIPDIQAAGRHFNLNATIITESECIPDIGVKANWTSFKAGSRQFSVTTISANDNLTEIKSRSPTCTFGVQMTGFATYEAYAYFLTPFSANS
ncbi:IgGFc-binding protein-like [Haliotis rubra]|uniref:IgGFc-binding protein-like n=1 Tax=Haliotis rubra TaxID=36100 RepID=UPI001EE6169B|nr:IgGFc-binding protein-like [Haliotis rubra]